eukprot:gnl/TRDRNA2_/TRDRNA2_187982_c0_seq1.p1 gnl/TRDRNA2_/TRDRNA2_187982_c0~~gnl/TRDRNA2_/TRDRNA2_187982_c0_seq1.p1  ORF type:complete len:312 (-),score=51.22 gnl/TRDRNA2_/TRDRNA2_187982_c0_seq1:95-904(-)
MPVAAAGSSMDEKKVANTATLLEQEDDATRGACDDASLAIDDDYSMLQMNVVSSRSLRMEEDEMRAQEDETQLPNASGMVSLLFPWKDEMPTIKAGLHRNPSDPLDMHVYGQANYTIPPEFLSLVHNVTSTIKTQVNRIMWAVGSRAGRSYLQWRQMMHNEKNDAINYTKAVISNPKRYVTGLQVWFSEVTEAFLILVSKITKWQAVKRMLISAIEKRFNIPTGELKLGHFKIDILDDLLDTTTPCPPLVVPNASAEITTTSSTPSMGS